MMLNRQGYCDFCDHDAPTVDCKNGRGKVVAGICAVCAAKASTFLAQDQKILTTQQAVLSKIKENHG